MEGGSASSHSIARLPTIWISPSAAECFHDLSEKGWERGLRAKWTEAVGVERTSRGLQEVEQQLDDLQATYRQEVNRLKKQIDDMGEAFKKQQELFEEQIRMLKLQNDHIDARNRQLEKQIVR